MYPLSGRSVNLFKKNLTLTLRLRTFWAKKVIEFPQELKFQ